MTKHTHVHFFKCTGTKGIKNNSSRRRLGAISEEKEEKWEEA